MPLCPNCHEDIPFAKRVMAVQRPGPGDWILCTHCVAWAVFDDGLKLRHPTDEELHLISQTPQCIEQTMRRLAN